MDSTMDAELEVLIERLPARIQQPIRQCPDLDELLEVVLDQGRDPEARCGPYAH